MSSIIVTNKTEVMELIFKHSIHKAITVKAVKRLSAIGKKGGNTGALAIVNSGYTDPIFEDLCSTVLTELCNLVYTGICTVEVTTEEKKESAKLIFSDSDEENNSLSFLKVYRSVSNYLYNQRQKESKWLHIEEIDEEGEEVTTYSINDKLALSIRSNLNTIEEMDIIKQVRQSLKDSDGEVLTDLLNGLSYREIATKHNATKKAVECAVNRIRKAYPKEEIKRISEVMPVYTDTTKHTYFDFTAKHEEKLTKEVAHAFNQYLVCQSAFMDKVNDNTLEKEVVDNTPQIAFGGASGAKLTTWVNANTRYTEKHVCYCTPFNTVTDRKMLLHDKLNAPSTIVEKPKAKIIIKTKKN